MLSDRYLKLMIQSFVSYMTDIKSFQALIDILKKISVSKFRLCLRLNRGQT